MLPSISKVTSAAIASVLAMSAFVVTTSLPASSAETPSAEVAAASFATPAQAG
jgi:hypothetical protein